jgi:hypothetical protein
VASTVAVDNNTRRVRGLLLLVYCSCLITHQLLRPVVVWGLHLLPT